MNPEVLLRDPLTGVYSRAFLQLRLQEEFERALRYDEFFSLMLLDLDHFKSVNDAFGHRRGDQVLVEFVSRLQAGIRAADILFRYGGDEFVLLLPNTDIPQAVPMAVRLLDIIQQQPFEGDPSIHLSLSIGIASYPEDGDNPETLFEIADLRQYEAKRRGRGRIVAENSLTSELLPFDEISRVFDRDNALRILYHFFKVLPEKKRGLLHITGVPGSGKTRFLNEVVKNGRLQGYEVVSMRGNQALSTRLYGTLNEAFRDWDLPAPLAGAVEYCEALEEVVKSRFRSGLLIAADNLVDFDWATLELLQHLFVSSKLPQLALAYTSNIISSRRLFVPEAPLKESIEMHPLSIMGMQIWLRSLLKWDPPADFVKWIYEISDGLPGNVEHALNLLVEKELLRSTSGCWELKPEYSTAASRDVLQQYSATPPHYIPTPASDFIGRDQEIQQVKDLFKGKRLITLTGPGGVGKTRLSLQVASEVLEQYANGVYFVALTPISSAEFLVTSIADALKFQFYSQEDTKIQLINYLRGKQILLVLDNMEHIIQGAGLVSEILENAPGLRILVTSRERLNIQGESALELMGMNVPDGDHIDQVEMYSAVQLFLMHARQVQPDFTLHEEDKPQAVRICQLVEGLPLGIELSAAWTRELTCKEIADEIANNLDFLVSNRRDIPERHRSLRAVFEHSWRLLPEAEKLIFARLSVFPGSFKREAASAVSGASLPILTSLVNKSLLYKISSNRYILHEVLNQYAQEKLDQQPKVKHLALECHCEFFAQFLKEREERLRGKDQKQILEEIQDDLDNIRAGWEYAIQEYRGNAIAQSLRSLVFFYEIRGLFEEGKSSFNKAITLLEQGKLPGLQREDQELLLARLRAGLRVFYSRLSQYAQANTLFEPLKEVFERLGAKRDMADLLMRQTSITEVLGNTPQAIRECQECIELYKEIGDAFGLGRGLTEMGKLFYDQGEYAEARRWHEAGLKICRENNDSWGEARALINIGTATGELGNLLESQDYYNKSLIICKELGNMPGISVLLNNLGDVATYLGNITEAKSLLEESLRISQEIGDIRTMSYPLDNLAHIAFHAGDYQKARQLLTQSLDIARTIRNRADEAYSLSHLGLVAFAEGNPIEAKQYFHASLLAVIESSSIPLSLEILEVITEYLSATGQKERAFTYAHFILNQPAIYQDTRHKVVKFMQELQSQLPQEKIKGFKVDGSISLDKTLQMLLDEMN